MLAEDIFSSFKSEFVRDEFDTHCSRLHSYLKANQKGIKINDLASLNTSLAFLVENCEDVYLSAFDCLLDFFEISNIGFIKEKNFDDKLNNDNLVSLLNIIAMIVDKANWMFEREDLEMYADKAKMILLLAFKAIAFVYNYLSEKITFVNNLPNQKEISKLTKVEYFTIKRTKNLRECEKGISEFCGADVSKMASSKGSSKSENRHEEKLKPQFLLYEQSNLPIMLIDFLQKHSSTLKELAIIVLEIKQITSQHLSLSRKLVSLGFLKDIVYIINDNKSHFREYFLKLAFEILWNYVEILEKEAILSIESEDILLIFKEIFCLVLANGFKLEDKILRNELIVMINNLLESGKLVPFVHEQIGECGSECFLSLEITSPEFKNQSLLKILLYIAIYDEVMGSQDPKSSIGKRKKLLDLSNEDLQFKKLVINALYLVIRNTNDKKILDVIEGSSFIEIMLLYINTEEHLNRSIHQFSQPQLKDIQSECLATLEEIAVKFTDKLLSENILQILMKLIAKLKGDPRVMSGLRILLKLLEVSHKIVQQQFGENSLFDIILEYLNSTESLSGLGDDDIIRTRTYSFMIIAKSCFENATNQRMFAQKGGIESLTMYLKNQKLYRSDKNVLLIVSVFSALWSCVVGNVKNEDLFLESDGFFILIEFLENSLRVHLKMTLSAISGIMENRKSFHYFEEWISSTSSCTATQLFIRLYQEEDKRFKVEYKDGVLVNTSQPLNPKVPRGSKEFDLRKGYSKKAFGKLISALKSNNEQMESQNHSKNVFISVDAILIKYLKENCELLDLRRSIFAILYRIGFDRHKISKEDSQILTIIQNYPQLRVGEIWTEIKENFRQRKIEPTFEDSCFINRNIKEFKKLIEFCTRQQEYISKEKKNQQEEELNKFYELVKHQKKYVR
jgi:hypothetical protein